MFIFAALFGAVGQFLYKAGTERASQTLLSYILNWQILLGVLCYIAVMLLFIGAFKKGGQPVILYPIYASTFIWAALLGLWLHKIPINGLNVSGMVLLIIGMYLMGR